MSWVDSRRVKHRLTWKIVDFLHKMESTQAGVFILSPEFVVVDPLTAERRRLCLSLYPGGHSIATRSHVGIYLRNLSRSSVQPEFNLMLFDEGGQAVLQKTLGRRYLPGDNKQDRHKFGYKGMGSPRLCTKNAFRNNDDKVVVAGAVTFVCDVTLEMSTLKTPLALLNSDLNLGKNLFETMKEGVLVDFTLVCGEKRFACNKFVLAARSSVFRLMFENSMEDDSGEVSIDGVEPEVFEKFLEYLYANRVDATEHAKQLFLVADRFDVVDLKKVAERALVNSISPENATEILIQLDNYGCAEKKIETAALRFAVRCPSVDTESETWKEMLQSRPRLAEKLDKTKKSKKKAEAVTHAVTK